MTNELRKMADSGFDYAAKNNLLRTNHIHGEQEAKLMLEEGFSMDQTQEESVEQSQNLVVEDTWVHLKTFFLHTLLKLAKMMFIIAQLLFETQDRDGDFMSDDLPTNDLDMFQRFKDGENGPSAADEAAANSQSFKLLG